MVKFTAYEYTDELYFEKAVKFVNLRSKKSTIIKIIDVCSSFSFKKKRL